MEKGTFVGELVGAFLFLGFALYVLVVRGPTAANRDAVRWFLRRRRLYRNRPASVLFGIFPIGAVPLLWEFARLVAAIASGDQTAWIGHFGMLLFYAGFLAVVAWRYKAIAHQQAVSSGSWAACLMRRPWIVCLIALASLLLGLGLLEGAIFSIL